MTNLVAAPAVSVVHRDDEFNQFQLDIYAQIERRHFWFHGRRRFLEHAVRRQLARPSFERLPAAIDLGGGAGGWVNHLRSRMPRDFGEIALGDSSPRSLELAASLVGPDVPLHHIDLRALPWQDRWDVAFLFDVLEHIRDDVEVLLQISAALRPGGLLFVTTPALMSLWSYNDDLEHHARRYSRRDFQRLADDCGLELVDSRYFMFFLSPLLVMSRWFGPDARRMSAAEIAAHYQKTHRVPPWPVNQLLQSAFGLETPLGHWVRFPWGTSVLAILKRR